jgi:hypothetical protein
VPSANGWRVVRKTEFSRLSCGKTKNAYSLIYYTS